MNEDENEDKLSLTAIQWFNKGYDYDVKEDYENAVFVYTKAIELNPKDSDAYINRGAIYDIQNNYDLALADYTKAIELDPAVADAYINRGVIYAAQEEYDLAIADYDQAIALNPEDVDVYIKKVFACEKSGHCTGSQLNGMKQKIRDLGGDI